MELSISINTLKPERELSTLKSFIDKQDIDGVSKSEIEEGQHIQGTQGIDILNSKKVIIEAAEKPLVELINCIQKYVDSYHSKVTIKNSKGATLDIDMGRGIDKDTLKIIVQMFLTETA